MDEILWLRVAATFVVDGSLAVLCGLLLSSYWLGSEGDTLAGEQDDAELHRSIGLDLNIFSVSLFLTLCAQFLLLAIDLCGQVSFPVVMKSIPDVAATHSGEVSLALCIAAAALCAAPRIHSTRSRMVLRILLLAACIALHAAIGHAAIDGIFSLTELLQLLHLFSIALWSGGVLVSGFLMVPRLSSKLAAEGTEPTVDPARLRGYWSRLSGVSTWAVGIVVLSGIVKSYRTTGGSLNEIRFGQWGHLLLAKSALVTLTILLGARNRWLLRAAPRWNRSFLRGAALTLRAESICMVAVLVLSAWLANSMPPME